jgi:hypothetical protein
MRSPKLYIFILLGILVFSPVFSQNTSTITKTLGNYRVDVDPVAGTFKIVFSSPEETVILSDTGTPYGSVIRVLENNRPLQFSQVLRLIRQDISFDGLALDYLFIDGSNLRLWFENYQNNELRFTYRFQNEGQGQKYVQVLLDTVLGELGGNHFFYNDIPITREFGFTLQGDTIVSSPIISGVLQQPGLFIQPVYPAGNTQPVQIALGNTRRLTETFGFFTVNSNRNFNLLPFSVNDSAILMTQSVESQGSESMILRLQFGSELNLRGSAFVPTTESRNIVVIQDYNRINELSEVRVIPPPNQQETQGVQQTLSIESEGIIRERLTTINQLNRLLLQIDQALSNPNHQIDVEFLEAEIERIRRSSGL